MCEFHVGLRMGHALIGRTLRGVDSYDDQPVHAGLGDLEATLGLDLADGPACAEHVAPLKREEDYPGWSPAEARHLPLIEGRLNVYRYAGDDPPAHVGPT